MPFGSDFVPFRFSHVVEHHPHSVLCNPPDGSLRISPLKSVLLTNKQDTHGSEEGVASFQPSHYALWRPVRLTQSPAVS